MRKVFQIRYRILFIVFIAAALPLLAFNLFSTIVYHHIVREKYMKNTNENMSVIGWNIDNIMVDITDISNTILSDDEIQSFLNYYYEDTIDYESSQNKRKAQKFLINLTNNKTYISSIYIGNSHAELGQYSTETYGNIISYDRIRQEEFYQKVHEARGKGIWMDPLELGISMHDNILFYAKDINDLYKLENIGVLIIGINKKIFEDMLPKSENIYLILSGNEILYTNVRMRETLTEDEIAALADMEHEKQKLASIQNTLYDVCCYINRSTGWKIINLYPDALLTSEIYHMSFWTLLLTVLVFSGIAVFAFFNIQRITRQISNFEEMLFRIQHNRPIRDIPFDERDDMGRLGSKFIATLTENDRLQKRLFDMELQQKNAELLVLQQQINPHFLYNIFNTVFWMGDEIHSDKICNFAMQASEFYRLSLDGNNLMNCLERELNLVKTYLEIQKIHYSNRFDYVIECGDEEKNCPILQFILQPIVENALNHGLKDVTENGLITISVIRMGEYISIKIADNGCGFDVSEVGLGYALGNIKKRLSLFYGEEGKLFISSKKDIGTEVEVSYRLKS